MAITLREATAADIPALEQLITEAGRALSASHSSPSQIESAPTYLFGIDTLLIADGAYYVAENEKRIIGGGARCVMRHWDVRSLSTSKPDS